MEELINYLLQFGHLNQQQIDLVQKKAKEVQLKKDDYFSEAGKIAKQVAFIVDGIFRVWSTPQESLLTMEAPKSFSYKNDRFTSKVLGFLLKRLEGEWLFTGLENSKTRIEWTYRAIPTNFITGLLVRAILMRAVLSMLKNALTIVKNDLENGQLEGYTETTV